MSTWWRRPTDRLSYLVGATVLVAGIAHILAPPEVEQPQTVVVPITNVALVCPVLPGDLPGYTSTLKATLREGTRKALLVTEGGTSMRRTITQRVVTSLVQRHNATGIATATGSATQELMADASLIGTTAATRGYAAYSCQPPGTSQWLVGGDTTAGHSTGLYIANVDDTQAVVDIEVWTDKGRANALSLRSVPIPAHSRKLLSLALVEPGRTQYVVHVVATAGQVTSAILHRAVRALQSLGSDVVAGGNPPAQRQEVGILPRGVSSVQLAVLSPGAPTTAQISLATEDGEYALAGYEQIEIDADRITLVTLPDEAFVTAATIVVRADRPIVAGANAVFTAGDDVDVASVSSLQPINQAASFTVDAGVTKVGILLSTSRTVGVRMVVGTGKQASVRRFTVVAGRPKRVNASERVGSTHPVSIEPDVDGVLRGSVLLTHSSASGKATALQPLTSLQGLVAVPPVEPAVGR